MSVEIKNSLTKLDSIKIEKLKAKMNWIFIVKDGKKINEKICSDIQQQLIMKQNFLFNLAEVVA